MKHTLSSNRQLKAIPRRRSLTFTLHKGIRQSQYHHTRPHIALVCLIAFSFLEGAWSSSFVCSDGNKMLASKQYISCIGKLSPATQSQQLTHMRMRTTSAWLSKPSCSYAGLSIKRRSGNALQIMRRQPFCAQHDSKQFETMHMQPSSADSLPSIDTTNLGRLAGNEDEVNHHHWFEKMLPEGWCVGVCTANSLASDEEGPILNSTMLHPNEYEWGKDNIASDSARTSFYMGRMALRSSLKSLLESDSSRAGTRGEGGLALGNTFNAQLYDRVGDTAIMKDYYGRPILPEIMMGSISHKGEYAVGLAQFRPSTFNGQVRVFDTGLEASNTSVVEWREECPILDEDENLCLDNETSTVPSSVRGIGIDLERIDAKRGTRIQRKVLTENERKGLGGLEEIGISSEEEVVLRFSLKESVYKAMHPILCQYVGFQEAEITPFTNGTAHVMLNLTSGSHERFGIVVQSASWEKMGDFFLTSASAGTRLKD